MPVEPVVWRFAAARATGAFHRKADLPCQDELTCAVLANGTLVAAVADGAGSATLAERGARIVVDTVVRSVSEAVRGGRTDFAVMLREAASQAREDILTVAREQDAEAREFASTLLAAVVGPTGGASLQIGDGVIVVSQGADGWRWVFWPQRGEYANTTRFLTDEDAAALLQVDCFVTAVTDIALMTDGLEPLALHYASRSVHEPFFEGMFGPLVQAQGGDEITQVTAALERFLGSERVADRTDDDVSLIMATRRPQTSRP